MGSTGAGMTYRLLRSHVTTILDDLPALTINERGIKEDGLEHIPLSGSGKPEDKADEEPKTLKEKIQNGLKILIPHVGLTTLLLSYIAGGAAIFQVLEANTELERRKQKLLKIYNWYDKIYNASFNLCQSFDNKQLPNVRDELKPFLQNLSYEHEFDEKFTKEDQLWNPIMDNLTSRWSFQAAVLYALTVITTTGYDHVTPLTDAGRLFAVFFGLFGIPLMFITAADIGKFLSEVVTKAYAKLRQLTLWFKRTLCTRKRTKTPTLNGDLKNKASSIDEPENLLLDDDDDDPDRVELPIVAYFLLILGYCAIGGFMFTRWERGAIWSFLHGFFFSFNTITTIGLGNILVRHAIYVIMIVVYVIVGLAVITMCVDLASSQLKVLFTKLHYFGRKFRGAKAFMNMSDDIKEAMKIIAALKKNKTTKGGITLEDIKQFLEIEQQYLAQPYVPQNINFIRWVDEDTSSTRSGSICQRSQSGILYASDDPGMHM